MARRRNSTVYTGLVGAKMRPVNFKTRKKPVQRALFEAKGGPLNGKLFRLELGTGDATLPIALKGERGRYVKGQWEVIK